MVWLVLLSLGTQRKHLSLFSPCFCREEATGQVAGKKKKRKEACVCSLGTYDKLLSFDGCLHENVFHLMDEHDVVFNHSFLLVIIPDQEHQERNKAE